MMRIHPSTDQVDIQAVTDALAGAATTGLRPVHPQHAVMALDAGR
jgi:hypothetical protein